MPSRRRYVFGSVAEIVPERLHGGEFLGNGHLIKRQDSLHENAPLRFSVSYRQLPRIATPFFYFERFGSWFRHGVPRARNEEYHASGCYPLWYLSVGIFSVVDGQDKDYPFLRVDNIEQSELADSISPSIGRVALKLFDVGAPEWFCCDLWIDIGIELLAKETRITGRQLLELFRKLVGFENAKIRQNNLVPLLHRECRS